MMCNEQLHIYVLSTHCLVPLADRPFFLQRHDNRRSSKVGDGESRPSTCVQHDATSAVVVRMSTADGPVAAARRMNDGVHALQQTSSVSTEDGIGAAASNVARHPPPALRGEASEEANERVERWD